MGQQKSNFIVRGGADFSGITKGLNQTQKQFTSFQGNLSTSFKKIGGILAGAFAVKKIINFGKESVNAFNDISISATKLERVMKNTMGATSDHVKSIKKLINDQERKGVIGIDVQLAGAQELSTYLGEVSSLKKLIPVMNDMAAQQYGLGATTENTTNIATMLGKVMNGQVGGLSRYGYSFTKAQEKILKFGTEEQRVAVLTEVVSESVGGMNEALAKTPAGQMRQLRFQLDGIKVAIGEGIMSAVQAVLPLLNRMADSLLRAAQFFSGLMQNLFGTTINIEDQTSSFEGLGNAVEDVGKKAKKAVAPFDELKQVNSSSGSNTSSSSGSNKPNSSIIANSTDKNKGFVKSLEKLKEVLAPTTKALGKFGEALKPIGKFAFDNIINFYNYGLKPIGKWILGEGLPRLLDVGTGLLNSINWSKLTDALKNLYGALSKFVIGIGSGLISFIELMASALKPIVSISADLLAKAINGIAIAIKAIPEEVAIAIGGAIGGLVTAFLGFQLASGVIGIIGNLKVAIAGLLTSISAHPIMWIAGGIAALAGASMALAKAKFDNSQFGQYINGLNELQEKARGFNKEVGTMLDNYDKSKEKIEIEYGAISILASEYFKLADKTNRTNSEQALLVSYAQELISKIPELSEKIDGQTGAYKGTKEEINSLIQKTKEYYLVQAAKDHLIEIAKKQYEADKLIVEQTEKRNEVERKLNERLRDQESHINNNTTAIGAFFDKAKNTATLSVELFKLQQELDDFDKTIKETKESQNALNKEWEYATGYIAEYSSTGEADINKVKSAVESTSLAIIAANIASKAKGMISDFNKEFSKDTSSNGVISSWLGKISGVVSKFKLPNLKLGLDVDTSGINNLTTRNQMTVAPYATGGFPSTGELFVANENGPEMLGKMGNRNVVANNMQIADGIEQAAYNGFIKALKDSGGLKANVKIDTDTDGIFKVVQNASIDYTHRTGRPAFT